MVLANGWGRPKDNATPCYTMLHDMTMMTIMATMMKITWILILKVLASGWGRSKDNAT